MPFVSDEHRKNPDMDIPGDRCYVEYKKIVDEWKANPRWGTADSMMQDLIFYLTETGDDLRYKSASILAFLVLFNLHIMPYELQKRQENGSV